MAAPSSSRGWADLDGIVLLEISKILDTRVDKLHMRAVCTTWRSYCPLPTKTPPLILPFPIAPNPLIDPKGKGCYIVTESIVYGFQPLKKILNSWGTAKTWIVKIDESGSGKVPGKPVFIVPFYKSPVLNTKLWPKVLNSLDYRVTEISKDYSVEFVEPGKDLSVGWMKECCVLREYAFSKPFNTSNEGLAVMALHNVGELAVWRTGEKKWSVVNGGKGSYYIHVAFYNGLFYAIEFNGSTITVDPVSLKVTPLVTAMINPYQAKPCKSKYLLKSFGDLFMIHKYGMGANDFCNAEFDDDLMYSFKLKAYKLNEAMKEWVPVKELKDRVLFASHFSCSFSVLTKDFAGLRGNCVICLDSHVFSYDGNHPGFYAGVFDLEEDVTWRVRKEPSFSKIFWPPPALTVNFSSPSP